MIADLEKNHHLIIDLKQLVPEFYKSVAFFRHPVWSFAFRVAFRISYGLFHFIWYDALGHGITHCGLV